MPIHYEKRGRIVTITIDRPERRNALDLEHFGQLADAWVRFRDDDEAWVAILTGVGDVYCVGADLKSFIPIVTERADKLQAGESKVPQEGSAYTMAHSLVAVMRDGATLPDGTTFTLYKPVIAAINGICLNGPLAVRACKQSAKESAFLSLREALANESRYSATVFMSDDAKEGLAAFREKRAPVWCGR